MGRRRYPPLTPSDVTAIVTALGFSFKNQEGSHQHYERPATGTTVRAVVTIDVSVSTFDEYLIKSMVRQSTHTREEFYGATKATKKKI